MKLIGSSRGALSYAHDAHDGDRRGHCEQLLEQFSSTFGF